MRSITAAVAAGLLVLSFTSCSETPSEPQAQPESQPESAVVVIESVPVSSEADSHEHSGDGHAAWGHGKRGHGHLGWAARISAGDLVFVPAAADFVYDSL